MLGAPPTSGRLRLARLAERHSLPAEAAAVLLLYGLYESGRGLVVDDPAVAGRHARVIVSIERSLHIFVESDVQHAGRTLGVLGLFGVLYLTLHLLVTAGYLLWLHRCRPAAFPLVRTTLVVASALALIAYVVFPTAPPRLAGLGISDTISNGHIDLNKGLISALYNPFAAVPSMHVGYAVTIGASLVRHGGRRALRVAGILYPALILLVIVATGNHFFLDAVAGAAVAALAAVVAAAALSVRDSRRDQRPLARPVHEFG
jgi:PAP2 superfamily